MRLSSSSFAEGGTIPKLHTCDGKDVSPSLEWSAAPSATAAYALIFADPDAPAGTWVHWVIYDLPKSASSLPEGLPREARLQNGARHGKCWGVSSFSRTGYYGPCPPPGKPHRYRFTIYALDAALGLEPGATKSQVEAAMKGHILAQTTLTGLYGR